jgi:hypothetical protein
MKSRNWESGKQRAEVRGRRTEGGNEGLLTTDDGRRTEKPNWKFGKQKAEKGTTDNKTTDDGTLEYETTGQRGYRTTGVRDDGRKNQI